MYCNWLPGRISPKIYNWMNMTDSQSKIFWIIFPDHLHELALILNWVCRSFEDKIKKLFYFVHLILYTYLHLKLFKKLFISGLFVYWFIFLEELTVLIAFYIKKYVFIEIAIGSVLKRIWNSYNRLVKSLLHQNTCMAYSNFLMISDEIK